MFITVSVKAGKGPNKSKLKLILHFNKFITQLKYIIKL